MLKYGGFGLYEKKRQVGYDSENGKSYINNSINLINKIAGYAVKIIMAARKEEEEEK